ncbi:MAG TPA: DNA-3-methyladenine glycosylase [Vicinamibacterales bacterium]
MRRGDVRLKPEATGAALPRSFYDRPTITVAKELLGKVLVHRTPGGDAAGIIVESEAYIGEDDPACHAAPGPTSRNAPLYGPPGMAYVYLNYGIHYLVNAVTEADGHPAAVLIRALEPLEGIRLMRHRRAPDGRRIDEADLCRGPGNLTKALGIDLSDNLLDLTSSRLRIEDRGILPAAMSSGPRIGIRVAVDRPWRFWIAGNPAVSRATDRSRQLTAGSGQ